MHNFLKKFIMLMFFACFSINYLVLPMDSQEGDSGSSNENFHTPPRKKAKTALDGSGLMSPNSAEKTPKIGLTPTVIAGGTKRCLALLLDGSRKIGAASAASSSAGASGVVLTGPDIIADLQELFFDSSTEYSEPAYVKSLSDIGNFISNCTLSVDQLNEAVATYIHLVDFDRCLLYGRKMDEFRYNTRFVAREKLSHCLADLFECIDKHVKDLVSQGSASEDRLLQFYSIVKNLRPLLLLGCSVDDFEFTLYASCFKDFLKIVKKIENTLVANNLLLNQNRSFEKVFTIDDEHVGYVENNNSGEPCGGHRFHINNYPLFGPGSAQMGVIFGSPAKAREDEAGVSCVNWSTTSGIVKASTLFPECYNRMFLIYLQKLWQAAFDGCPHGFNRIGFFENADGCNGKIYIQHTHNVGLGSVAGSPVCTCSLPAASCPNILAQRPLIINVAWRKEFVDFESGDLSSANYVIDICTAYPMIYVCWDERAVGTIEDQSCTPARTITLNDLFLVAVQDVWLKSHDAYALFWRVKIENLRSNFCRRFSDIYNNLKSESRAVKSLEKGVEKEIRGRRLAIVSLAKKSPDQELEHLVSFIQNYQYDIDVEMVNALIHQPMIGKSLIDYFEKQKSNLRLANGHVELVSGFRAPDDLSSFLECSWLDAVLKTLKKYQENDQQAAGASSSMPIGLPAVCDELGAQETIMILPDGTRFITCPNNLEVMVPKAELLELLEKLAR